MHDYTIDRTTNCSSTVPKTQCRCGPVNDLTLAALKFVFLFLFFLYLVT